MNSEHTTNPSFNALRYYFTILMIILATFGLGWRIFDLTIRKQHFLQQQGDERVLRLENTPAFRGMILDRNGYPLAVSTTVYSIWANPREFTAEKNQLQTLANTLKIKPKEIQKVINKNLQREFVYLKRDLPPLQALQIKSMNIPGVYLQRSFHRYYPEGEVMGQLLGFTNVDDQGQEGLELAYNDWLRGEPGKKWVVKDRLGRDISDIQTLSEQKPGHDLVLSIDRRVQYLAYRELMRGVLSNQAESGSAVILDVKTNEILGMVNFPAFNPNNRQSEKKESFRNRAVTDTFEPGSTIKPFSIARALESGIYKMSSVIDTGAGWIRLGRKIITDEHTHGLLTLPEILKVSSDVGVIKISLSLPADKLWDLYHNIGLGEISGIGFPGEQSGTLVKHHPWGELTVATMAIGYGLTVTALQLAQAYSILANGGLKRPLSLLHQQKINPGEQVISPKVAKEVLGLLEFVLEKGGTGFKANVPGYRVGGKTGTAKIVGLHGYEKHRYTSSFIGIAPLSHPRYVVVVVIHDPRGKFYYGGDVSGPVFAKIMEGVLRMMDIPPDASVTG